jgi:hypothetical protein
MTPFSKGASCERISKAYEGDEDGVIRQGEDTAELAERRGIPLQGRRFSAGWGTRGELEYHPVRPDLVAEFQADTALDEKRYRHPVRFLRLREDLTPGDVAPFDN